MRAYVRLNDEVVMPTIYASGLQEGSLACASRQTEPLEATSGSGPDWRNLTILCARPRRSGIRFHFTRTKLRKEARKKSRPVR